MAGEITPAPIMQTAAGFLAAKQLFAAADIDLFEALSDGSATLEELADRTGTSKRPTRIVADAMVSVGLVEKQDGQYRNSQEAAVFLSGDAPPDMRPVLRLMDLEYQQMTGYIEAVRTGDSSQKRLSLHDHPEIYSAGIEALSGGAAQALPEVYDFDRHERLLDLGGGTGIYLRTVLGANPDLRGTLLEFPRVADIARNRIEGTPLNERVEIVEGDFMEDSLPEGHDAVLMANIIHNFPREQCLDLLRRVREAVDDSGRLLLVEPWMNAERTEPLMSAVLSGQLFLESEGEVYSLEQGRRWLEETGWKAVNDQSLAGPFTVLVGEAG